MRTKADRPDVAESPGLSRRRLLKYAGASLLLLVSPAGWGALSALLAVRIWPSDEYTRITLEGGVDFKGNYKYMLLDGPDRLVVDLEGIDLASTVKHLSSKVAEDDPFIAHIRAAQNRPGVVRVVIELKTGINPQIFTLAPVGKYSHRLVLDLYPKDPVDPLLALIRKDSPMEAAAGETADEIALLLEGIKPRPNAPSRPATAAAPKPQAAPKVNRLFTVVLDPGHGGEDPGAVGRRGTYEKHVTLSIAKRLKRKIDADPNMRAILTRDGDYFVPLQERVGRARRVQADLFVSIHADAFVKPDARGSSVFILSQRGASSSAANWLARKENESDLIGGVNVSKQDGHLARTLLDLALTATISDSHKLGKAVLNELGGINTLHKAHVEQAGFAVLKAPDIPSILVETAFISNPEEERKLTNGNHQDKMANAILKGIRRYMKESKPNPNTRIAQAD